MKMKFLIEWGTKHLTTLVIVLLGIITFAHMGSISLWDQDEAAYAGFAKHMLKSDNWLIPEFMWSEIHRKTPLHFWMIALGYKLFGISEFAVRLPAALSIFSTYLIVYFWGGKLFGKKTGLIAILVLATSIFVPVLAKISVTDGGLLFFSTLCGLAIVEIINHRKYWAVLVFWISFALALLLKGPPIVIFTAVFAGILVVLHPSRKNLIILHPWFFLPLALLPLFLWGYFASQRDGGVLINWMLDWYILKRINGSVLGQTGPPGLHFVFLIAFFTPYIALFPTAFWKLITGIVKDKGENLLLGAWFVAGWLFYEFSPSKLPAYAVVAHVPMAIMISKIIIAHLKNNTRPLKSLVFTQVLIACLVVTALFGATVFMEFSSSLQWITAIFALGMTTAWITLFRKRESKHFFTSIIGLNLTFQFVIWVVVLPLVDNYKDSTRKVSEFIASEAKSTSEIIIGNTTGHPPSLPFYLSSNFSSMVDTIPESDFLIKFRSELPVVLILTVEQKNQLNAMDPSIRCKEISSFFVDRKGKANYFIALNTAAKK